DFGGGRGLGKKGSRRARRRMWGNRSRGSRSHQRRGRGGRLWFARRDHPDD
ncbi:hypothetical protein AX15_007158, partial [Amanita polypyramis BW_CC]